MTEVLGSKVATFNITVTIFLKSLLAPYPQWRWGGSHPTGEEEEEEEEEEEGEEEEEEEGGICDNSLSPGAGHP